MGEHVHLAEDPSHRIVVGFSSGGNAALTAAWHRPDVFGCVVAFSASFPQIPGGNPFPQLIASEPRRLLRVFLQVGHRDLGWDEPVDNWLVENLRTSAALLEAGYDARLVLGDGGTTPATQARSCPTPSGGCCARFAEASPRGCARTAQ